MCGWRGSECGLREGLCVPEPTNRYCEEEFAENYLGRRGGFREAEREGGFCGEWTGDGTGGGEETGGKECYCRDDNNDKPRQETVEKNSLIESEAVFMQADAFVVGAFDSIHRAREHRWRDIFSLTLHRLLFGGRKLLSPRQVAGIAELW